MFNYDDERTVDNQSQENTVQALYRGMCEDYVPVTFKWTDDEQLDSSAHVSVVDGMLALLNVA